MRNLPAGILFGALAVALLSPALPAAPREIPQPLTRELVRPHVSGTLEQAFQKVADRTGMKLAIDWKALEATGVTRETKVLLKPSRCTGAELLEMILIQVGRPGKPLSWDAKEDTVLVTTQNRVIYLRRAPAASRREALPVARDGASRSDRPGVAPKAIDFDKVPLSDAIAFFRNASGANIHVNWRALSLAGIEKETPVSLRASNISIARALDLVLDNLNAGRDRFDSVYWVIDRGVVLVSTGSALNKRTRTEVYDIRDLLIMASNVERPASVTDLPGGTSGDSGDGDGFNMFDPDDEDDDDSDEPASRQEKIDTLVELVKNSIGEDMWRENGGPGTITVFDDKMIVTQSLLGFKLLRTGGN